MEISYLSISATYHEKPSSDFTYIADESFSPVSEDQDPVHVYTSGTHIVTLTATGITGAV